MALISSAQTHWEGDLASGSGTTTLESGATDPLAVSWRARTEEHGGLTSPEELIAAAHASCYSMALSADLARNRTPPTSLDTQATATFAQTEAGWRLTTMHLTVRADVPRIDPDEFQSIAEGAKTGCPVSHALEGNVQITLEAALA
jgi:osmotically inducible protein OsmC